MENNELLTVEQTAEYLKVTQLTIYKWIYAGTLPAAKIGGRWRIRVSDLESLWNKTTV